MQNGNVETNSESRFNQLLVCQSVGFLAIIGVSWINECVDLRALVLGDHPYLSDFREATLEMLIVLTVWLLVVGGTRRILARVNHLEGFLRICAWCRRIGTDGRWVHLEEFINLKLHKRATHGMCEHCCRQHEAALDDADAQRTFAFDRDGKKAKPV